MLFSDTEGSTALRSRLGDQYGEALSGQRAVLRAAIDAWHGREMGAEGDSFYVICESASDAVECCIADRRGRARPSGAALRGNLAAGASRQWVLWTSRPGRAY
jgi:class 3 adenylate cyclase